MGKVFGIVLMGALFLLALGEVGRFWRARREDDQLPYPRRRLMRRLGLAVCFCTALALVIFWPFSGPWVQLAAIVGVLVLLAAGLVLLWRDLAEASRAIVEETDRFHREASEEMLRTIREHKAPGDPAKR